MDLVSVLKPFFDFFVTFCNVSITLGGFSFSVGALFMWCFLGSILIGFIRGLAS